jgi:putative intracellular protease/amidase
MKGLVVFLTMMIMGSCMADTNTKRVLMMVSEGFYAPEYFVPLEAFKKAGFKITTATKYKRATRPDERQVSTYPSVNADITFKEINVSDYDAIVFAGGNGAWEDFFPNQNVHNALTGFMKEKKIVALLCSSTGLLGVANNLSGDGQPIAEGRNVTGYKRVKGLLVQLGKVNYSAGVKGQPHVVVDGNLITGRDPISSELFARTVVNNLK